MDNKRTLLERSGAVAGCCDSARPRRCSGCCAEKTSRPSRASWASRRRLTLGVFALVDLALWRVQRRTRLVAQDFAVPRWLPLLAAGLSLALVAIELVD